MDLIALACSRTDLPSTTRRPRRASAHTIRESARSTAMRSPVHPCSRRVSSIRAAQRSAMRSALQPTSMESKGNRGTDLAHGFPGRRSGAARSRDRRARSGSARTRARSGRCCASSRPACFACRWHSAGSRDPPRAPPHGPAVRAPRARALRGTRESPLRPRDHVADPRSPQLTLSPCCFVFGLPGPAGRPGGVRPPLPTREARSPARRSRARAAARRCAGRAPAPGGPAPPRRRFAPAGR